MPFPHLPRTRTDPRRRTVLASALGAVAVTGCSSTSDGESSGGSQAAFQRVRARAARDSAGLLDRYDATIAAFPALRGRLAPLRAEVARHADAFGWSAEKNATRAKSAAGTASPSPTATRPASERDALAALAALERTLADRRTAAVLDVPGEPARLLASVAAAGAAHVYLLTETTGTSENGAEK
ncbi:hypothetical protein ACIQOU_13560 [Streptomyces sp. NPDC091279]|uniref:hypothetical protein n=1 Tax=unclassified Streptomyces TaxID=2593676 RepID=UPI0037F2BE9E